MEAIMLNSTLLPFSLIIVLGLVYGFLMFSVMHDKSVATWDAPLGSWVAEQSTPWGKRFFSFITELGTYRVVRMATALLSLWLVWERDWIRLAMLLALFGLTMLVNYYLKHYYRRSRPTFQPHTLKDFSFPSGHTMLATAFYLMVAYLGWIHGNGSWLGWIVVGLALALVVLIGFSRFYLGVHFMTDVLGGWAAGGLMFLAVLILADVAAFLLHLG